MVNRFVAFVRLSRPIFLTGGLVLYALGALVARYQGAAIDWWRYALGQVAVTSIQLMTHHLNDYFDVETDRLNAHRTYFSGGSGVLSSGALSRATSMWTALVCLTTGAGAMLLLAFTSSAGALPLALFALATAGACSYSSPPLALASSGLGEAAASLVVSLLVPSLGYSLQAGSLSWLLAFASAPLVALNFAMLLAFDLPDLDADAAVGKRTALVRLGAGRGAALHAAATAAGFGAFGALGASGPWQGAALPAAVAPLGVIGVLLMWGLRGALPSGRATARCGWLTFAAVALFALACALEALGFYLATGART